MAVARMLVGLRLDTPLLAAAAAVLHRAPSMRVAHSVGWHLGQAAGARTRVARLRSGSRMAVDVRDHAHRHAFLFGLHEEDATRLVARISRPGWTVLDVGANAGYFSLLACDLGGLGSRAVAFEPNPRMVDLLHRSAALNPRAPLEIVAAACGEHDGQAGLYLSPDPHNTGLSRLLESTAGTGDVPVAVVRLDAFCAGRELRPDLIKIYVEGGETGVLFGAEQLLREGHPSHVICELWAASRDELVDFMAGLGYVMHDIRPDGSLGPASAMQGQWQMVCFRHDRADRAQASVDRAPRRRTC